MNGELYHISCLAAASKKALRENTPIRYTPMKHESGVSFSMLPQKRLFGWKKRTTQNAETWFEWLKERGLQDVKLLCAAPASDPNLWGFANTAKSSLVCFFQDRSVTFFTPYHTRKEIEYCEYEWSNPPPGKPHFEDNTDALRKILKEIGDFALQLEDQFFADWFARARSILDGANDYPDAEVGLPLPQLPAENLRIFEAASFSDVFGGMGWWTDSPAWIANEKGLKREYESLSAELLMNMRLATQYAVNEW